jgi:hypothetical protein
LALPRDPEMARLSVYMPPDGSEPDLYGDDDDYGYIQGDAPSLEELFRAQAVGPQVAAAVAPVVEITHLVSNVVHDPFVLRADNESYLTPDGSLNVHVGMGGGAITLDHGVAGTIRRQGRADAEEQLVGPTTVLLAPTDAGKFVRGDSTFFIRVYRPEPPKKIRMSAEERARTVISLVVAVLVAAAIHGTYGAGMIQASDSARAKLMVEEPEKERFADVAKLQERVKELKESRPIEVKPLPRTRPKPKARPVPKAAVAIPEPDLIPEPSPEVPKAARTEVANRVAAARQGKTRARALADTLAGVSNPNAKPGDTVGKLGGINVTADGPASGTAVAAMGTPGGGQFGAVGAEGSGNGGGVATKGGKAAVGSAGKLKARRKGRVVRGKVRASKSRARVSGEGELDKAKVYAVIQKATRKIQGCYERALLKKPSLSGQIKFKWTIMGSGKASGVRVQSSSISDAAVAGCIRGILAKLRYPKPKGGPVTISFPFMFKASSQ